jgi:hypothetical protein
MRRVFGLSLLWTEDGLFFGVRYDITGTYLAFNQINHTYHHNNNDTGLHQYPQVRPQQ